MKAAPPALLRLPFPLLIALRYLRTARRDAYVRFLSTVAAGGIGLGVAALVLALAALTGMQAALKEEVLARTAHLEAELPPGAEVEQAAAAVAAVPGVLDVHAVVRGRGWLRSGRLIQAVEIVGYSGDLPATFPGRRGLARGLFVSGGLAGRWGLMPGDPLSVISPRPTLTPLGLAPRSRTLALAGTFASGRTEDVERVALPLAVAATLVGARTPRLAVRCSSLEDALSLAPAVAAALPPGSRLESWRQLNRPLFFALSLERAVMFVAVSLIIVVGALSLVSDLALVVASKRAELGMLGAMGATAGQRLATFLLLGTSLAGIGLAGGGSVGWGLAWLLDRYRLVRLPGEVYFLDHVPFAVRPGDAAVVALLTLALAAAGSLLVAQRAAALQPVEAMRR